MTVHNTQNRLDDFLLPKEATMNEFFASSETLEADIDGEPVVEVLHPYNNSPEAASIWMENASETFTTN